MKITNDEKIVNSKKLLVEKFCYKNYNGIKRSIFLVIKDLNDDDFIESMRNSPEN